MSNETDLREVVRAGLRKCRVEDAPVPLIREADLLHVTHMVAAELVASDWLRSLVAEERAAALRQAADDAVPRFNAHALNRSNAVADWLRERADRMVP